MNVEAINTILYCADWEKTVAFYRDTLGFREKASTGWLVEFAVAPNACLSVADAGRTSIRPTAGAGITLTFKVADLPALHEELTGKDCRVDPIRDCKMGGQAFFLRDPEGNRLEFWADSPWSSPEVVARFSVSSGNDVLFRFAEAELKRSCGKQVLDIGCGAGSNAIPLARMGWNVHGLDLSEPMLEAAIKRAKENDVADRTRFEKASMDQLPVEDQCFDFIVAHGIWNLARSAKEFRAAVREAARAAKPGVPLFVYTFSRSTLPPEAEPVDGEQFVFTEFSGRPQCFLTEQQLTEELARAGFLQEPGEAITEYPRIPGGKPAILEGIFRRH